MSNIQLGGTHTIAKRGGTAVDYQGRKKHKTTNMLLITDARGIPFCCSQPIAGNHHDAYKLVPTVRSMLSFLKQCTIRIDGLFFNADSGFDTAPFRTYCEQNDIIGNIIPNNRIGTKRTAIFDTLLNKNRFVIERTNAWMDAYKALLIRYETNKLHWKAFNLIALCLIFIKQL